MRLLLLSCCFAGLLLALSCSDNSTDKGIIEPALNYEDVVGAWRGTLDSWHVDNSNVIPNYTLQNVDITLIFLESQRYWLELNQLSDSLEYRYKNEGFWLWDPTVPDVMIFEMYEESSTQIFNPVQDSGGQGNPDSTGTGGGGATPDTVKIVVGDNTKLEARFISFMDLDENQMRLYDFIEYLNLGDVTLDKF